MILENFNTLPSSAGPFVCDAYATARHCNALQHSATHCSPLQHTATNTFCSELTIENSYKLPSSAGLHIDCMCVAVCCSVLQSVAVCCSVLLLQCVAVCRSVSQCVAVCRSVSQCVAVCHSKLTLDTLYKLPSSAGPFVCDHHWQCLPDLVSAAGLCTCTPQA